MPIETLLNENGYAIGLMHPYHTYRNWIWNSLLITTGISSLGLSYSWTNRFKRREKNTLGIFYYNKELVKHKRAWHLISHATLSGASLVAGIILSLVAVFSIIAFEGGILYPSFDGIICILGAYLIPQLFLLLFDL